MCIYDLNFTKLESYAKKPIAELGRYNNKSKK